MMPAVTHCCVTATCQSTSSAAGSSRNQGVRNCVRVTGLLLEAELLRGLAGCLGQELVGVVLRHLARHVARDYAVVRQELGDALDRLQRQRRVEPGDADRL